MMKILERKVLPFLLVVAMLLPAIPRVAVAEEIGDFQANVIVQPEQNATEEPVDTASPQEDAAEDTEDTYEKDGEAVPTATPELEVEAVPSGSGAGSFGKPSKPNTDDGTADGEVTPSSPLQIQKPSKEMRAAEVTPTPSPEPDSMLMAGDPVDLVSGMLDYNVMIDGGVNEKENGTDFNIIVRRSLNSVNEIYLGDVIFKITIPGDKDIVDVSFPQFTSVVMSKTYVDSGPNSPYTVLTIKYPGGLTGGGSNDCNFFVTFVKGHSALETTVLSTDMYYIDDSGAPVNETDRKSTRLNSSH